MKKLFKEVWKSFSKSKVILAGLIILIFLTSGIITLIFDVTNSYKTQLNNFKKKSVLQDVTMNSSLNLYGTTPSKFYEAQETKYKDKSYLIDNQWEHIENKNSYIDSIQINTESNYFNLRTIIPSLNEDLYVKTQDLTYLLNANLNLGNIQIPTQGQAVEVVLDTKGNNNIITYKKNSNGDFFSTIIYQIDNLFDSYNNGWQASKDAKNLYNAPGWITSQSFNEIVIDKENPKNAYLKKAINDRTNNSSESLRYKNNPDSFLELSSEQVGSLLGFRNFKLDKNLEWILEGNINDVQQIEAKDFFSKNNQIPPIKNSFNLQEKIEVTKNLSILNIPTNWFVYSQYKYIFTRKEKMLNGINFNNEDILIANEWSGYYNEYLNNLKQTDINKLKDLASIHFWTKDVVISKVDYLGNEIKKVNENNEIIPDSNNATKFDNIILTTSDLELPLINKEGQSSTLSQLENIQVNENNVLKISTDLSSSNEEFIKQQAQNFKYKQIYDVIKKYTSQIGIRETLTVNANSQKETNVYQFINLGNSNNEINWNGINIKQNVGKLINTNLNNDIFKLPSNINAKSNQVPLDYVPQIIDQLLTGLSLNRDYINPMISFNSFTYYNVDNLEVEASGAKIIWVTKDGQKNLNDVYGISAIQLDKNKPQEKNYFILKKDNSTNSLQWIVEKQFMYSQKEEFFKYIQKERLNFAPFDVDGNDLKVVSEKGWAKQNNTYSDKYSVPFQYYLPNSDLIEDFNQAQQNPNSGKHGMEMFRDNLIHTLTLSIRPLIPASLWSTLMEGVNTAFSDYGFGAGLTPPAALTTSTIIRVVLGVFYDSVLNSNEAFMNPLFTNILNGIKRSINKNGNASISEQKLALKIQLKNLERILSLTIGSSISLSSLVDEQIDDPSSLIDGLDKIISSINLDKAIIEIWESYIGKNYENDKSNKTIGTGDFLPALYGNIYSTETLKNGIKEVLQATKIGKENLKDVIEKILPLIPDQSIAGIIKLLLPLLGNKKVFEAIDWLQLEDPIKGKSYLESKTYIKTLTINNQEIENKTIKLKDIMSLFTVKALGIINLNIGDFIDENQETIISYNPTQLNPLELDMDLLWYLKNYVFKQEVNQVERKIENMDLFGIDPGYFISYATSSFTEIKEDDNQITMTENDGKLAIVNQAFLEQNNKLVYQSKTLEQDLNDLSQIDNKYKIDVDGVEYLIIGSDFSVDYMYPVINSENVTVNTKTQALVYVNQHGYDRIKRSNTSAPTEKYFLLTAKNNESPIQLQTKLNEFVYEWATGNKWSFGNVNSDSNTYKLAYLRNESSLLNPERSLRLTVIEDMIINLENVQKIVGIMLTIIVAIVIMFVVRRYIGSRAKVLGILKAQGYSSWQIASSICLFPLFVSIIGATLGYITGLVAQYGVFKLFTIFWTIPIVTIPFNWLTFVLTLIIPIVLLCSLTILTTFWFLHKNKSISMMNGSMEVNESHFANSINKLVSRTSVKNKFSISLALGSIGKLIALFISALFTAGVTLFFVTSYKAFDKSINRTYANKTYKYIISYTTPTVEGNQMQIYYIYPGGANNLDNIANNIQNMLYVPVGDPAEGYVYYSDYFKPGYNETINKNGANGDVAETDTTTPHIFTKASIDLTVNAGGMSINVWKNLYNAIPESQRSSIISKSQISNQWLEWTQEGKEQEYQGKKYITKFENFNTSDEYLTLFDKEQNKNVQIYNSELDKYEDIRIDYFNFEKNEILPENSKFIYRKSTSNNAYYDSTLLITGNEDTKASRALYREFLVNGYKSMFNYDSTNINSIISLLDIKQRTPMPEYELDYFISPGALIMMNDQKDKMDETFTYIDTINILNQNMQPKIYGYKYDSKHIQVVDSNGQNLIKKAEEFAITSKNEYPLIINKVVAQKYGLKNGNILTLRVNNKYDRYSNKLKEAINTTSNDIHLNIESNEYKFKIIGISDTYINEEWITAQSVANKILGLNENGYNGTISDSNAPIPIASSLPLYSSNGYWSADNKIFTSNSINDLSNSELQRLINTYRQLFYTTKNGNIKNVSLIASFIDSFNLGYSNDKINTIIKNLIGLDNLDLNYSDSGSNFETASKANNAIKKFIEIYTDNSLYAFLENAISNGVEKEYIVNASSTVNKTLTIMLVITFTISLTILVMITSMIINENERNIAIFGVLGYTTKEKIRMFFSIYIPIVFISILFSILVVWLIIPTFLSTILATTSILLPMNLSIIHVLIASGILTFVFAITCMIAWIVQGKIKPIVLLKEV
ncbi:ABC transporter permease [Mesomycoplasma moatsii]|uniref:ABC transporter permease n=1 Tax=Mesomycoplasma moatsii TaxID=171287 RepID=UPI0003B727AE